MLGEIGSFSDGQVGPASKEGQTNVRLEALRR